MDWRVLVDTDAEKQLLSIPKKDALRIRNALEELVANPFTGDLKRMKGEEMVWRRRVGSYRILFEVYATEHIVYVFDIERRTTTTYRKGRR